MHIRTFWNSLHAFWNILKCANHEKVLESDLLYPSAQKIDQQVESKKKDLGWSFMIQEKVVKNLKLLRVGVAK